MDNTDIFCNSFNNLSQEDIALINRAFRSYEYEAATYSFLANYIWCRDYNLRWEQFGDFICMAWIFKTKEGPRAYMSMPLSISGNYDSTEFAKLICIVKERYDAAGIPFGIGMVPFQMVDIIEQAFPGRLHLERDEDVDEYVYEKDKLITLSGRALHKKKNHLNYFRNNFNYEVKDLTADMKAEILRISDLVNEERERDEEEERSLRMERNALEVMIEHLQDEGVYSAGIFIEGQLQAFAIGERIGKKLAAEHFEKANINIRGIYQAICSEFCRKLPEEIELVNREEDMGIENLRQAKQALKPCMMAEKRFVEIDF